MYNANGNGDDSTKKQETATPKNEKREREIQGLLTPVRVLFRLAAAVAPKKYKKRIKLAGKKVTAHGISDAAVVITLIEATGASILIIVAVLLLGLVFSAFEE